MQKAESEHQTRLEEKNKTLAENIIYYGDKVQVLIQEISEK